MTDEIRITVGDGRGGGTRRRTDPVPAPAPDPAHAEVARLRAALEEIATHCRTVEEAREIAVTVLNAGH